MFFEPCHVVILDPTNMNAKNISPHCSQIHDIIALFKNAFVIFKNLQSACVKNLAGDQGEDVDAVVSQKVEEIVGSDGNILLKSFLAQTELLNAKLFKSKLGG